MPNQSAAILEGLESRQLFSSVVPSPVTVAPAPMSAVTASATASRRVFYMGNSLTDGMSYSGQNALLTADGSGLTWGRQTGSGFTQANHYYLASGISTTGYDPARPTVTNPWGTYTQAFASQWDVVTVQPHERHFLNDVYNGRNEAEVPMTLNFMRQLAQNSPNAQVYLYSRPSRRTDVNADMTTTGQSFDYSTEWNKNFVDSGPNITWSFYNRSAVTQLLPLMRQAQLADPVTRNMPLVKVIPVGEAYYNIDQAIKAGKFAGTTVSSILDLYIDQSHPTPDFAAYVIGLTFATVLTGNDPRGTAVPAAYSPTTGKLSNATVVALVQQAVYDAVHATAYRNWSNGTTGDPAATGSISVKVFSDTNRDGLQDASELPLQGVVTYLDRNNNSVLDTDETVAISDSTGAAVFTNVSAGNYIVRTRVPDGFVDSPASSTAVNVVAGRNSDLSTGITESARSIGTSALRMSVFTSRDGTETVGSNDTPLEGVQVYFDTNNNNTRDTNERFAVTDTNGSVQFDTLAAGTYTMRIVSGTVVTTRSVNVGARSTVHVLSGVVGYAPTSTLQAKIFDDKNRDGTLDAADGVYANTQVFIDANANGVLDSGEVSAYTGADGVATFTNLIAGSYHLSVVAPTSTFLSLSMPDKTYVFNTGMKLVMAGLATVPGAIVTPPPPPVTGTAQISGYVVKDTNSNGVWNSGELGIAARTVYIDANNNGALDTGETTQTTASNGKYTFGSLPAGTYKIRQVLPTGWSQTYPTANAAFTITIANGAARAGVDFCTVQAASRDPVVSEPVPTPTPTPTPVPVTNTARISGTLFWDDNKNGVKDAADSNQIGKTVFIDANGNNILDANERKLTTDANGAFAFDGLSAGEYKIRRVVPSGYRVTTPALDVAVTDALVISGVLIGTSFA